jgi:hypothetical protein
MPISIRVFVCHSIAFVDHSFVLLQCKCKYIYDIPFHCPCTMCSTVHYYISLSNVQCTFPWLGKVTVHHAPLLISNLLLTLSLPTAGLEKTRVFLKKPSPVGFFGFFLFFFAQTRGFLGFFSSFTNTFRCIQTLNYNHSYQLTCFS